MKRLLAGGLACLAFAGCVPPDDFADAFFGIRHNVVVLASGPFELSRTPTLFTPSAEAEVVGKHASVCVVLAGDVPVKGSENEVQRRLDGAAIKAVVTTGDGATHEFSCAGSGWAKNGRILASDEITACVHPNCSKQAELVGSKIRSIALSSTAPVHALGAYWESTAAFDRGGK